MITAAEALEMSNEKGERLIAINNQMDSIGNQIVDACLAGERSICMKGSNILGEVDFQLKKRGYDLYYFMGDLTIRW